MAKDIKTKVELTEDELKNVLRARIAAAPISLGGDVIQANIVKNIRRLEESLTINREVLSTLRSLAATKANVTRKRRD